MNRPLYAAVCFAALVTPFLAASPSAARPATPAPSPGVTVVADPAVTTTLRALDRLRAFGYTWTSDAGADRAIRHWQKVNGLVVDGTVGTQTAHSLGLDRIPVPETPKPAKTAPTTSNSTRNSPKPPVSAPITAPEPPVSGDIEGLIRSIWPDDSEDWAVRIARRESNLQPGVSNSCCYGLFQIHFRANQPTLNALGITSPEQLFDPTTNINAALAIFERSGTAPWRL